MFTAETTNIKSLTSIFNGASNIVDEIQVEIDSDGMRARALDRSHVSFIGFELTTEFFDEYEITEPETLHIDMDSVVKILKRSKSNDTLKISTDNHNIIFTFIGESTRTFKIHQIDMDYTSPEPPKITTPINKLPVPFHILKETITDMDMVTDKININVDPQYITFTGNGNFSDLKTEYPHGEKIDTEVNSNYSLDYIKHLLNINKVADTIHISLGADTPILMNLEGNNGDTVEFLLAPRMEREE